MGASSDSSETVLENFGLQHEDQNRCIIAHESQRNNPVVGFFQETATVFSDSIGCDFICGPGVPVIFIRLSSSTNNLFEKRVNHTESFVQGSFVRVKVLLCLVDCQNDEALQNITISAFKKIIALLLPRLMQKPHLGWKHFFFLRKSQLNTLRKLVLQ